MRTAHRVALITAVALLAMVGRILAGVGVEEDSSDRRPGVAGAKTPIADRAARAASPARGAGPVSDRAPSGTADIGRAFRSREIAWAGSARDARAVNLARVSRGAREPGVDLDPAERFERRQPAPTRLVLDPLRFEDDGLSLRATGHDARGPRELVLWRLYGEGAAVVARGRSRRDGALEFPRLVAPHRGLVLIATPAWETPLGPRASSARLVAPRAAESRPTGGGGRRGSARR